MATLTHSPGASTKLLQPVVTFPGGKVTSAGWQVTLCDPIWYVISCSGEVSSRTALSCLLTLLYFT